MFPKTDKSTAQSTSSKHFSRGIQRALAFSVALITLAFFHPQVTLAGTSISVGGSTADVCAQSSALMNLSASGVGVAVSGFYVRWYRDGVQVQAYNMGCAGSPSCNASLSVSPSGSGSGAYHAKVTYTFFDILRGNYVTRDMISNTLHIDFSPTGAAHADFSINGHTASTLSLCQNEPILIDGSTSSCASGYFVSVQRSDHWWNRYGHEANRWLTTAEAPTIGSFDTRGFAASEGLTMEPGNYYRVKLAVSNPWDSDTKLVYLRPAQASFRINGSASNQINVGNNEPMILDGADSTCASNYFVSIQESDPFWNRYGTEHMRWLSAAEAANIGGFDLRNFLLSFGEHFDLNKYYRVKLAVGNPWHSQTRLVYID